MAWQACGHQAWRIISNGSRSAGIPNGKKDRINNDDWITQIHFPTRNRGGNLSMD